MHRVEIMRAMQLLAYAICRPEFDVSADPTHPFDFSVEIAGIVGLRYMQPAIDQIDAGHLRVENGAPDILEPLLRQCPELFGVIESDTLNDVIDIFGKSRKHKAHIAARRRPGHVTCFKHRDGPPTLGDLARDGESGEPRSDHTDIDIEIEVQARTVRASNPCSLVPAPRRAINFSHQIPLRYLRRATSVDIHSMTMRRLLLFRHAKAERSEPGMEDRARKLIERGRKDAAKIGAYMATHALIPDWVIASPSARTQETWKIAGGVFRPRPTQTRSNSLYDATAP